MSAERTGTQDQPAQDWVGRRLEVEVGPVAHGGHCVARHEGRVLFVRHTLPGERVAVVVTEDAGRFLRADAVEVVVPSPDRVEPPCPFSGPGRCGGCDWQHASLAAQRELKAAVVAEQLSRLAGIDRPVRVEALADLPDGGADGLHWRTRMQYVDLGEGRRGLRRHRSHGVVEIDECRIAHPEAREILVPLDTGVRAHAAHPSAPTEEVVVETVEVTGHGGHDFRVAADGFWQVHPAAPRTLVEAVLALGRPQAGERVLDLYAGVGLFSAFLADAVGPGGHVEAVEGDKLAVRHARENLAGRPTVEVTRGRVDEMLRRRRTGRFGRADLVVLDPPRTGAKRRVVDHVAALRPRAVVYVACDPAALARDVALFADHGLGLRDLRAFDLFPMTHHVECVALLEPGP